MSHQEGCYIEGGRFKVSFSHKMYRVSRAEALQEHARWNNELAELLHKTKAVTFLLFSPFFCFFPSIRPSSFCTAVMTLQGFSGQMALLCQHESTERAGQPRFTQLYSLHALCYSLGHNDGLFRAYELPDLSGQTSKESV